MRRLIAVLVVLAGCPERKRKQPPPPPKEQETAPVAGAVPLGPTDDKLCAQMVTALVKHSNWTLQIENDVHDRWLVHHDGSVEWRSMTLGLDRKITLTPAELEEVKAFGKLSCESPMEWREFETTYRLEWGENNMVVRGGNSIRVTSPLGAVIERITDAAIKRYVESRHATLAPITIRGKATSSMYDAYSSKTAQYQFEVAPSGVLTVKRGTKSRTFNYETRDVVDLADKLLASRASDDPHDWLRGTITAAGRTQPFAFVMPRQMWADAIGVLSGYIRDVSPDGR